MGQRKKHIKNVTTLFILGGIMRFTALLVCALFVKTSLFALTQEEEKGLYKNKLPNFQIGVDIDPDTLRDRSKEINPQELLKQMDTNSTKFKEQYGELKFLQSKEAEKHAKEAKEYSNSKEFKDLVKQNKDHILYDKSIDWSKYSIVANNNQELTSQKQQNINKFLDSDDRVFIVISESIPKETIIDYFKLLENVNTDVTFILRGVVGNDISQINPTLNYIRDLLIKDKNVDMQDPKNHYHYNIEINPKIIRKFKIESVPAVVYVQGYNQALQEATEIPKETGGERYYIAYGNVAVDYALQKINQEARSKSLENLIKNMENSFFK